jgi:hypothetical protein
LGKKDGKDKKTKAKTKKTEDPEDGGKNKKSKSKSSKSKSKPKTDENADPQQAHAQTLRLSTSSFKLQSRCARRESSGFKNTRSIFGCHCVGREEEEYPWVGPAFHYSPSEREEWELSEFCFGGRLSCTTLRRCHHHLWHRRRKWKWER